MSTSEERTCALCGSPDRDKVGDHLRESYKISQDGFDKSCFSPRLHSFEMDRLQRGSNPLCSNRAKCRQRISEKEKARKQH